MRHTLLLAACAAAFALPAAAAPYTLVLHDKSQIRFVSKQMGVPIEGSFGKFSAQIAFDPARPQAGHAQIEIDMNSIDAGSEDATVEVKRKGWFDTQNHPTARFISTGVKALGDGRYEALGKMTIKGRTQDVVAPFSFTPQGNGAHLEGGITIKRLQFGIGEGAWSDTSTVADDVAIRFRFVVAPAPAPAGGQ